MPYQRIMVVAASVWLALGRAGVTAQQLAPQALPAVDSTAAGEALAATSLPAADGAASFESICDGALSPVVWRPNCRSGPLGGAYPTVAVTGFFQADGIWFSQDATNTAVVTDAQDVTEFRRARLAAKGQLASNVSYFTEYDFAFPGRPSFMDVYVDVEDLSRFGKLRIGQWRQPFSMDAQTSVRELMFLERALPFAFVPFRQVGAGLSNTAVDESVTWAVSGYRFPTDVFGDVAGDGGYGFSTRETVLVYSEESTTLHVGGGYTYNRPSTDAARLRTPPEVGFNQLDFRSTDFPVPFFVDTGVLPGVDSYQAFNVELAGSRGPWLAQSEFFAVRVDQDGVGLLDFQGAYAQVAYALTGETHPYNRSAGVYSRITPHTDYGGVSGLGAWEVAGRWSYIDLTDGPVDGGVLNDLTCGLNWYLNRFTKFQFNYIHAFLERPAGTTSDADIFAVRAQIDF